MTDLETQLENFSIGGWLPRKTIQQFFGYGETKMSEIHTVHGVEISRIGNRVFYRMSDIINLLEDNTVK